MSNNNNPFPSSHVFVTLYVMLGDADGSISGSCVKTRKQWDKEVKKFTECLQKRGVDCYEGDDEFLGSYHVNMENYEVQDCTEEEAKVLKKFGCDDFGDFRSLTDWIDRFHD
jgi:hypothetical protein